MLQRLLERPGLHKTLGMRVVDVSPDRAVLQATVGPEICQYMGLLHGGASAALAETAACVGSCAATGLDVWPAVLETSVGHLRVGTLRRECLDRILIFGRRHLESVLQSYIAHYNGHRPHRSFPMNPPAPRSPSVALDAPPGSVITRDVLGGLIHEYERAA